ncbi:MAG: hypothetical protein IJ829_03400 [Kiritimatiellae bacterium]|nr:hypothetical protein [Kiritimatiellia bacterium]
MAAVTLAGGCTTAYWKDRACDAADVATVAVGLGGGAFVQVGPKPVGYGFIVDAFGMEDGKIGIVPYLTALQGVAERYAYDRDDIRVKRGKLPPLLKDGDERKPLPIMPHHWTELRLFAGVTVVSASIGVNPGELADFALGWLGLDIYGDDAESRSAVVRTQEESR